MYGGRGYAEYVILRHKVFVVRKSNGLCRRERVYVAAARFVAAELYRNSARPSVRYFAILFRLPVSARKGVDRYIVFNDGNFIRRGARRNHARRKHGCRSQYGKYRFYSSFSCFHLFHSLKFDVGNKFVYHEFAEKHEGRSHDRRAPAYRRAFAEISRRNAVGDEISYCISFARRSAVS